MNILPMVFAFILIFSFLTLGFIREHKDCVVSEMSINSFRKTSRVVQNAVIKKQYDKIKIAPLVSDPSKSVAPISKAAASKPSRAYHSRREFFPPLETSKFSLNTLLELQTDPKKHPLYEICAEFLRLLYNDTLFKQSGHNRVEYALLNDMIKKYHNKKEVKTFMDLYPDSPELQHIFYKMLMGTNQYDVQLKRGIPRLEDFFTLEKTAAIHFSFASTSLLEAILSKKIAFKILAQEKLNYENTGKNSSLTQDELTALLSNDLKQNSRILELGSDIDFSQNFPKRTLLGGQDKTNGLIVRKKL
jgi:hypothetical protein